MSYKVISPVVVMAPSGKSDDLGDANNGPRYFYDGAIIPAGYNDERCKELAKDGMLEEVSASESSSDDADKAPARSASKADWVAYATDEARGDDQLSDEDANALTKDELVERYSA